MSTESTLIARAQGVDQRVIDRLMALLLTVGALVDAALRPHQHLSALAVVSSVVLTGSVAWRRWNPVVTTLVATGALVVFQLASRYAGDGTFQDVAVALNFYLLGRRTQGRERVLVAAVVSACWTLAAVVWGYTTPGGTIVSALSNWAFSGPLPFAAGRALATQSALRRKLEDTVARLADEQELRARGAAGQERARMARELHDVIAHCVSVMVIQTSAAGRVARESLDAAHDALRAVEHSGREALVELRRIVGVLRYGPDEPEGSTAPGLAQLDSLVTRARAAGLAVDLQVEGTHATLSPGLDLVAYRVVQEAVTNAIKHAGEARAKVTVRFGARALELVVVDSGHGPVTGRDDGDVSGHGLVGMSERVGLYGGELRAGPHAGGGFEVHAWIPLHGMLPSPDRSSCPQAARARRRRPPTAFAGPGWIPCLPPGSWWRSRSTR